MALTPIISKYMARNFIYTFIVVFFILFSITYLFDSIEQLRRVSSRENADLFLALEMSALKLPTMVHILLPFVVLISSLFVFLRLTKSSELVIIRAAGVSAWQFIAPLVLVSFLIGVFNVTLFNPFASRCFSRFEKIEDSLNLSSSGGILDVSISGLWLKETKQNTQSTIHAVRIKQEQDYLSLWDMSIFEMSLNDEFLRRIEADEATLQNGEFNLKKVWVMEPGKPATFMDNMKVKTHLSLDKIEDNFASPETMSFWDIPSFIRFFEQTGFSSLRHKLYWYSLIFSPLMLVAMVFIASAFALKINSRQGNVLLRVIIVLASGFGLFFFSKLAYALAASSTIPILLAVLLPALIAISLSVFVLLHSEDG